MLFCLQAYDYAHFLFFLHFITYWLLLWTKRHSNCQTIVISFKNLREALDEPFRENGKRFCINFFFKSQPKPYRGLGKKKKAIGESSNFHSSGIVLGASACTHSYIHLCVAVGKCPDDYSVLLSNTRIHMGRPWAYQKA